MYIIEFINNFQKIIEFILLFQNSEEFNLSKNFIDIFFKLIEFLDIK